MSPSPALRAHCLAAAAFLSGACGSITVNYDYDPTASFDGLRTFAWRAVEDPAIPSRVRNPLLEKILRDTVTDELRARGFQESAAGAAPSFTVGAYATVRERVDVWTSYDPWGYGWRGAGWYGGYPFWGARTWVSTWDEGTFVLEIADGRSGAPLWRGTATSVLDSDETPEDRRARLRQSVREALAKFPPPL